jgi:hypothetical protein
VAAKAELYVLGCAFEHAEEVCGLEAGGGVECGQESRVGAYGDNACRVEKAADNYISYM